MIIQKKVLCALASQLSSNAYDLQVYIGAVTAMWTSIYLLCFLFVFIYWRIIQRKNLLSIKNRDDTLNQAEKNLYYGGKDANKDDTISSSHFYLVACLFVAGLSTTLGTLLTEYNII